MTPKKRKPENRGLPKGWQLHHGAYYYRVPPGTEPQWDNKKRFRLGKSLAEAYKVWAERMQYLDEARTIGQLLERYALEVVPTKAPKTQKESARYIQKLTAVFGHMLIPDLQPSHVYQYIDKREAKTSAIHEIALLRHSLTKAVEWGLINKNQLIGQVNLRGRKGKPRDRYIEDWEVVEALTLPSRRKYGSVRMVQAYIRLKILTGLRRGDLLRLKVSDCDEASEGIKVQPHKTAMTTGKRLIIEWSDELRAVVAEVLAARPVDISPYLFCNRRGEPYFNEATGEANGFDSVWGRFMTRLLTDTKVTERFTEHDLRAKCASDASSLEHAKHLLGHTTEQTTERYYRRKPERVKPLK